MSTRRTARSPSTSTAADGRDLLAAVGEGHQRLIAPDVVRIGGDEPVADDDATAPAAVPADPHDRGRDALECADVAALDRSSNTLIYCFSLVSCNSQVTLVESMATTTSAGQHEPVPTEPPEATALEEAVAQVGDRWTLLVVNSLLDGPRRFNELLERHDRPRPERAVEAVAASRDDAGSWSRRPTRGGRRASTTGSRRRARNSPSALRLLAHWGATGTPGVVPRAPRLMRHARSRPAGTARPVRDSSSDDETDDTRFV